MFQPAGRQLDLTETGLRTLTYADEIFTLGDELLDMLRDPHAHQALMFKVGVADVVPKSVAYRLVEPALRIEKPVRWVCREGWLDSQLVDLSLNRLDMVAAGRPMPAGLNVRGYNHFLGASGLSVFAAASLAATSRVIGEFDDSALLKAFGRAASGVFVAPSATAACVCKQYGVQVLGAIDSVRE